MDAPILENPSPDAAVISAPAAGGRRGITIAVLGFYAVFVLLLWAPLGPRNGMPYETAFAYQSQTSSAWDGFFFGDALRVHTNFFYQVSYLLSEVLGIAGSFVTYQIVYALLWWGQGVITYLAARRLWPRHPAFNFFLGALLLFHSSDHALNWVGQMNQFGMIFWMLVSFYFLILALQGRLWWSAAALGAAGFFAYMSLWSYESEIFTILAVPPMLLFLCGWRPRNILAVCLYWLVPFYYGYLNYVRYTHQEGSYQQSVLRPDFHASALFSDLLFNVNASLAFWQWPMTYVHYSAQTAAGLGIAGALAVIGGVLLIHRMSAKSDPNLTPRPAAAVLLLIAGLMLLALSFPAYLILSSARMLWRTQFLSGLGAAVTVAALVALIGLARKRAATLTAMAVVGALWAYFGTYAAYTMASFHFQVWDAHRKAIAAILQAAPSVQDGTIIVLTNVPKTAGDVRDPFGDVMWLDMAIRLAYPGKSVDAIYFYPDGTMCPSGSLFVEGGQWKWEGKGYPPILREVKFEDTLVLRLEGKKAKVLAQVPAFVTTDPAALREYHPRSRILDEAPSPMAVRRYLRNPIARPANALVGVQEQVCTMQEAGKKRLLVFIVAYNAERTIAQTLRRIPGSLLNDYEVEVLVIDDSSKDKTFEHGEAIRRANALPFKLTMLFNPVNLGYGGNQKVGFHYAVEQGFDFVALVHGDGQYAPECLPELVSPLAWGNADAVFGSRMLTRGGARKGGMPLYKFAGNKILTRIQNRLLRAKLSEFHSGYRIYSVAALKSVPFHLNSNDFHFDTEIIIQLLVARQRIVELPIPTYYGDEICHVNGLKYAKNVVAACVKARAQEMSLFYDRRFDCRPSTHTNEHYSSKLQFESTHSRVLRLIPAGSRVLDIGCAGGYLGTELMRRGCRVTGLDMFPLAPGVSLDEFHLADLNRDRLPVDLRNFDYAMMLDVIEHLLSPETFADRFLESAAFAPDLKFIISTANIAFLFTRLMLLLGKFNYGKRGILDLTHTRLFTFKTLRGMLDQSGFDVLQVFGIPAPFPLAVGNTALGKMMLAGNRALIGLNQSLFSYQMMMVVKPRPSLQYLLGEAQTHSATRSRAVERSLAAAASDPGE